MNLKTKLHTPIYAWKIKPGKSSKDVLLFFFFPQDPQGKAARSGVEILATQRAPAWNTHKASDKKALVQVQPSIATNG